MSPLDIGLIGIGVLLILIFSGMWLGLAMALVAFVGYICISGWKSALGVMALEPYSVVATYEYSVLPMFIFMGTLASSTRISEDLYFVAYKFMGHLKGGLAMATVGACSAFAAICGSSYASAVTMGKVCMKPMSKYGYNTSLASSTIAAGGTLGVLIPPSIPLVLYGILTEQSIGKLFIAGIFPGILLATLMIITIGIICYRRPKMGPPGPKTSLKDKFVSLRYSWATLLLFILVIGGIYMGVFTPSEAGGVGASGVIIIGIFTRRLSFSSFISSLREAIQTTAMIMLLFVGAIIFSRFLAVSRLPFVLADAANALTLPPLAVLAIIVVIYIILGMFLDIVSTVLITIPIIFPTIIALGYDPIWLGVLVVLVIEMGVITPPVGMVVFALSGATGIPSETIFRGVFPFIIAMVVCIIIITAFPQIALFLPNTM
ncbi:TRAP transporter large permease [Chloroflexota bacterium]